MIWIARLFLPATALGLVLAVLWRYTPPGRLRTGLQVAAALLVLGPHPVVLFCLNQSVALLPYQQAVLAFWLLGVPLMLLWRSRRADEKAIPEIIEHRWTEAEKAQTAAVLRRLETGRRKRNPVVLAIAGVLMAAFGIYQAAQFIGDQFLPRFIVEGPVQGLRLQYATRSRPAGEVTIGGQKFIVTRDLMRRLRTGQIVRAEIGAGSKTIYKVQSRRTNHFQY